MTAALVEWCDGRRRLGMPGAKEPPSGSDFQFKRGVAYECTNVPMQPWIYARRGSSFDRAKRSSNSVAFQNDRNTGRVVDTADRTISGNDFDDRYRLPAKIPEAR